MYQVVHGIHPITRILFIWLELVSCQYKYYLDTIVIRSTIASSCRQSGENTIMNKQLLGVILPSLLIFTGCAGNPTSSLAQSCENGLATAYKELDFAKASGLDGTVDYTKAASLLTAAKVQYQFEKYPNCIDKVTRARAYIDKSKK